MQNESTTLTDRPAIYCGTYGKYNDGSIQGKWLYFDDYADTTEFFTACRELHNDESDPEFMFQDYEYLPESLYRESLSTPDVDLIYEYLALDDDDRETVGEYVNATGYDITSNTDFESILDSFITVLDGYASHESQYGDYVLDEGLLGDIPENLQGYIDTEKLGRDCLYDCSVSDNGYVFSDN